MLGRLLGQVFAWTTVTWALLAGAQKMSIFLKAAGTCDKSGNSMKEMYSLPLGKCGNTLSPVLQ